MSESVEKLEDLLPHRPPMVLLSGYEPPVEEGAVEAFVDVSPESPFYDRDLGGVPGCVALEYMAQAMALLVGLSRRAKGLPPQIGFVLGSRRMEVNAACFEKGRRYRVTAKCLYGDEEYGSFACSVTDGEGVVAAEATLSAFQPGEGALAAKGGLA